MNIAYDPAYVQPLPADHRFPMLKYELIPGQLLHEGTISKNQIFSPRLCTDEIVLLTHTREYLKNLRELRLTAKEQRRIGFPLDDNLVRRELMIAQGTIDCALFAINEGVALNVAGGTHHAFADHDEGFCILNDIAIAANYLLNQKVVTRILIIDLDVHQGNGTASIFKGNQNIFTLSMHGEHNYPFHKEKSDLDIPLKEGMSDVEYLELLRVTLSNVLTSFKPDFAFFLAGVDILSTDRYGKLDVSIPGCRQRDEIVFISLKKLKIPCAVSMGGGYSADIKIIVDAHCNTFRTAEYIYR